MVESMAKKVTWKTDFYREVNNLKAFSDNICTGNSYSEFTNPFNKFDQRAKLGRLK